MKRISRKSKGKWKTQLKMLALFLPVIAGILAIINSLFDIKKKISESIPKGATKNKVISQPLSGSIRDQDNHPLIWARVSLPDFNLTTLTDKFGQFKFEVAAPKEASVSLLAQKGGYETYDAFASLGNTHFEFTMVR